MRVILICGDRKWNNFLSILRTIVRLKEKYKDIKIVEGGASGADAMARKAAQVCGIPFVEHKAQWYKYGKQAGPVRNALMLDKECPDEVIAFHANIAISKGTKDMISKAKDKNVPVTIITE